MEAEGMRRVPEMTCEYLKEPLGIQNESPRFGWRLPAGCAPQSGYRIRVYEEDGTRCL